MVSRDIKMLSRESAVFLRTKEYATLFDELHVLVVGRGDGPFLKEGNLYIYNTTSSILLLSFFKAFFKAFKMHKHITPYEAWVTSQDPFETGFLALIIAWVLKANLQLQIHTDFLSNHFKKESSLNRLRVFIARRIIPRAKGIRVVSERIKQSLVEANLKRNAEIAVLPVFIDPLVCSQAEPAPDILERFAGRKIILCAGRLEREKNFSLALKIFGEFQKKEEAAILLMAGEGSLKGKLRQEAADMGLSKKVEFLGFRKDMPSVYKSSNILLVTSDYEGYGMNMIEAALCGLPIVSLDVGIAKEAGAYIIRADDESGPHALYDVVKPKEMTISVPDFSEYKKQFINTFNL